jgi:thiol-disulfide isomerase/thioredoxin/flagellar biosynthesis regulator FlaF
VKSLIVAALLTATLCTRADEGVRFTTITTWQQALDRAKAEQKPIFLDAYTDWCGWCKVMDSQTFSDSAVAAIMNASFVNVKMEMETGEGIDVAMKYRISGFPTFMVFSPDGVPTYKTFGYRAPADWLPMLEAMRDPARALKQAGVTPALKLPFPAWHRASFEKGKARKQPETAVVQKWFDDYENKYDEVAFGVIVKHKLRADQIDWVLEREQEYRRLYDSDVDQVLQLKGRMVFTTAVETKDTSLLGRAVDLFRPAQQEAVLLKERLEAMYYGQTKDWPGLGTQLQSMSNELGASASSTVNEFAWQMYETCDDERALRAAASAMKPIATRDDAEWAHIDTYAALLFKSGQYAEAEVQAKRAIERGTAAGADVKETTQLLERIRTAASGTKQSK